MSRSQLSTGRENIRSKQKAMPRIGVSGTMGQRKGRCILRSVLRMISTAAQTIAKGEQAADIDQLGEHAQGKSAPIRPKTLPVKIVAFHGVRKRGCTEPKKLA
jgi:hypothetical protein